MTFFENDPPKFYEIPFSLHDPALSAKASCKKPASRTSSSVQSSWKSVSPSAAEAAKGLVQGTPLAIAIKERNADIEAITDGGSGGASLEVWRRPYPRPDVRAGLRRRSLGIDPNATPSRARSLGCHPEPRRRSRDLTTGSASHKQSRAQAAQKVAPLALRKRPLQLRDPSAVSAARDDISRLPYPLTTPSAARSSGSLSSRGARGRSKRATPR